MTPLLALLAILATTTGQQIEMTQITNPILPFSLGKVRVTTQKHTFIKYINLDEFDAPIDSINKNTKAVIDLISIQDELYPQLQHLYDHLLYLLSQITSKLNNLKPQKNIRSKRALLNIVGRVNKWLFGTLDDEDAERYDKAISIIANNQKLLHHDLENYVTITKKFMKETTNTLQKIVNNQQVVNKQIKSIVENINRYTLFLRLQNSLDTMVIDCQNILSVINNIENAILFAELNVIHSIILPLPELNELVKLMFDLYKESLPHFENSQSYYRLLKTEIYYNKNKILFAVHFPVLRENLYDYYHLFPVPIQDQTLIPLKPYIIINSTYHHYEDEPCQKIEDTCIYYVKNQISKEDCIPKLLNGNINHQCQTSQVHLEQDVIEPINNAYLIVIPARRTKLKKNCVNQGYEEISKPKLIKIPYKCSIKINDYKYENNVPTTQSTPLELPPIEIEHDHRKSNPLTIPDKINLDGLTKLQDLAEKTQIHRIEALEEDNTSYLTLYISLTLIIIIVIFIIYKFFPACIQFIKLRKVSKKEGRYQAKEIEMSENNIPVLFPS